MSEDANTDDNKLANDFLAKVANGATEMINLDIKTYVGEMTYENNTAVFTDGAKVDGVHSRINLLQGDIRTEMSIDFHANYQDLLKFHQGREKNGQEIIKNNIELVKSLVVAFWFFLFETCTFTAVVFVIIASAFRFLKGGMFLTEFVVFHPLVHDVFGNPSVFKYHEVVSIISNLFQEQLVVGGLLIDSNSHGIEAIAAVFVDTGLVFFDLVLFFEQGNELTTRCFKIYFMQLFLNLLGFTILSC